MKNRIIVCYLKFGLLYADVLLTGVQQGLLSVRQLEVQNRSWMSFFVALLLTLG